MLSPNPSFSQSPPQQYTNPPVQPKLTATRRLLISADLILSTIDDSGRKLLDSGANNIGRVVHHKYGAEAAESSLLVAGTARNVGLVYIDMSGMGRRALLRRAGMSFVKGRVQSKSNEKRPVPPIPGQDAQR
jgi:spartin